ncbi:LysR family transcriptional regulator [Idiomarina tyrosinivorans]|uniref:LysR family transcriptional regulator n=1 Tax=Idiomarina tyrosinivorans TaxID=1445662 RepID=A0A432ZQD4_9GAMM|nr:LysR family transcriptional regulator [Idiomarina tyrosinivorans]RUO80048.1 LysR family transcriptional regulator [Idiomarina tyrosinivorans]
MNITHLKMFAAVAELGSLQRAAESLHRTQSATSMALKKLEQEAGFALFERGAYRLMLTERGSHYLRQAQEVIRQHQRLASLSEQLRFGAEPSITLCYDHTCDAQLWLPHVRKIQQQFPATEVRIEGESQLRALQRIAEGSADLAISPWMPLFRQYGDFETLTISPFSLVVALTPQLYREYDKPSTRQQLLELPMLVPQNLAIGIDLDTILKLPNQRRIRVNDIASQKELLLAGMGWGVIPRPLIADALDEGVLEEIVIPGFIQRVDLAVHLIRSANQTLGPAASIIWQDYLPGK